MRLKQQMKKKLPEKQSGFTIVELLIVVIVIAILAAIVIISYGNAQQRAGASKLKDDVKNASTQLAFDNTSLGAYPSSVAAANNNKGLPAGPNTSYQYTPPSSTNAYCLTGTSTSAGGASFYVSSDSGTVQDGICPGHSAPDSSGNLVVFSCPTGFIVVPGSSTYGTSQFCVMKYEAKQASATVPVSQAAGLPWTNIIQTDAMVYAANVAGCTGCHLITEAEWLTIAQNVLNVASNWSGGAVGNGAIFRGHSDSAPASALVADVNDTNGYYGETNTGGNQRRTLTLSNGEVIWDMAGNISEWTAGQSTSGLPGYTADSSFWWHDYAAPNPWISQFGTVSPNVYPSFGTPSASGWNYTQGIGRFYSNANDSSGTLRSYFRGDNWSGGVGAGVYGLMIYYGPNSAGNAYGFRVAR